MPFWVTTLTFAGIVLLFDGVLALLIRRYNSSANYSQAQAW
jgi:hypothetical protein